MTSEITLESVGTSQTLAKVIDGAIRTNAKTGTVTVDVARAVKEAKAIEDKAIEEFHRRNRRFGGV